MSAQKVGREAVRRISAAVSALKGSHPQDPALVQNLAELSEQAPGMLFQLRLRPDGSSGVMYANRAMEEIFGIQPREVEQDASPMWERVDPADFAFIREGLSHAAADGVAWHQRLRMRDKTGHTRWFQIDASPQPAEGEDVILHGYLEDITSEVNADQQVRIAATVFDNSPSGIVIMSPDQRILRTNPGFTHLTGYDAHAVQGLTLEDLSEGLTPPEVFTDIARNLANRRLWRGELITRNPNGSAAVHAATVGEVLDDRGDLSHYIAVLSELSALRDDLVTGLPGRQAFDERLARSLAAAHAHDEQVALLVVGVDHFHQVNESLGHRAGDVVLREVATRIRQVIPEPLTVARVGGDEFAVLLDHEPTPESIEVAAATIAEAVARPIQAGTRELHLTVSVGIALYPDDAPNDSELLTAATHALRAAKDAGRDRYRYITQTMQRDARHRARLAADLRKALHRDEIHLVFQPVVRMSTARIEKAETLVRWTHPELGPISPAEFIPIAEASDVIRELGDWIFARAIDFAVAARQIEPEFAVSVNLSPAEIRDSTNLNQRRVDLLLEQGLPGSALVAEITEGVLLSHDETTEANLAAYREVGIPFAIDDFGTGYSSLAYLQTLDISYLKIDQSFVKDLTLTCDNYALCQAIITMGHALGLEVIAEGIESPTAHELLDAARCDFGQGYLFSPPVPGPDFLHLLREQQSHV